MESVEDIVLGEGVSASGAATEEELLGVDEHSWVQWYQKSWLEIEEGDNGRLINPEEETQRYVRSYRPAASAGMALKKGLIRFLYIVVDYSQAMRESDYKPNRAEFIISELTEFLAKFFAANPLSYVSIVAMRNGDASFVTRMNGQPNFQIKNLKQFVHANPPAGACSLVKAFGLILRSSTAEMPQYASREVVVLWGSLSSVDPVETPIVPFLTDQLSGVNTTVLSLSPEVFAVRKIASANQFHVALNATGFRARLAELLTPKENSAVKPIYIKMGFPVKTFDQSKLVKCCCHKDLHNGLYVCPQCGAFVCEIPTNCPVCRLTLVDRDMLARVHRLLYDMPPYHPADDVSTKCKGCEEPFSQGGAQCAECSDEYCYACDVFNHEQLKHCPGCLTR